jgi:2-desacetyl-2-hydroxyethyl bacteriochlorophyllide A dehydrogenase
VWSAPGRALSCEGGLPTDQARARELWFVGPRVVEVRDGSVPAIRPGQVLVRAIASGVSQGTELLLYRGEGPTPFDPALDRPGAPTYPRRYGYAWVGEVIDRAHDIDDLMLGARVFALASHGDLHAINAAEARPLDEAIPPARGVLAANLETAVTCMWDSGASIGDEVVVIGGGVVGLLVAWLAAAAGGRVRLVEPSLRRRTVARTLGVIATVTPDEDRPRGDADVVFEATGDPSTLDRAIAHAAREATVVVASFYGARTAPVSLGTDFHRRRIMLRSSQVSSIPPARTARWTIARRFDLVRALLARACLDTLIDPAIPFDDASNAYARLEATPGDALQTVFAYR